MFGSEIPGSHGYKENVTKFQVLMIISGNVLPYSWDGGHRESAPVWVKLGDVTFLIASRVVKLSCGRLIPVVIEWFNNFVRIK